MKNLQLYGIAFILAIFACKSPQENEPEKDQTAALLQNLNWLEGQWSNLSPEQQAYEHWERANDSLLLGHSFILKNKDTVFEENMRLFQQGSKVYLEVRIPNQNEAKPVSFTMLPESDEVFSFENLAHDFPQRINYHQAAKDSIHAWIEGMVNDTLKKVDFYFKRQP